MFFLDFQYISSNKWYRWCKNYLLISVELVRQALLAVRHRHHLFWLVLELFDNLELMWVTIPEQCSWGPHYLCGWADHSSWALLQLMCLSSCLQWELFSDFHIGMRSLSRRIDVLRGPVLLLIYKSSTEMVTPFDLPSSFATDSHSFEESEAKRPCTFVFIPNLDQT